MNLFHLPAVPLRWQPCHRAGRATSAAVDIGDTPLIARSALFGKPVKSGAPQPPTASG